jgi:tetratricopeptide (TPR) repeat protein
VKRLILVVLAALAAWQQPSAPARPVDLERAYRANNLGVARLEQFDYEGAATSFRGALQITPTLHIARLNLAIALLYAGRPADAAPEARAAAAELSGIATAHYVVGLIAKADNNLDEAATAFERVLQIDARDAGARIQLGQVQLQRRRYDEALKLFQEALAAEPETIGSAQLLECARASRGRRD